MFATIEGYYEQGQVFLKEEAPVTAKTAVIITFLTETSSSGIQQKRMPGGLKGKVTLPDDFNESLACCQLMKISTCTQDLLRCFGS